jgi:N6-adenosine-specific RNA methylase IME4
MDFEAIRRLPIARIASADAELFLWTTDPMLPLALELLDAWGFTYQGIAFAWCKRTRTGKMWHIGMGYTTRKNIELCLLARRGRGLKRVRADVRQIVDEPVREHSRKPDCIHDRIVRLYGDRPRIELFARQQVPGWKAHGNAIDGLDILDAILRLKEEESYHAAA